LQFLFRNENRPLKGTGTKLDVRPGCSVSSGAKLPVAPVESAPMHAIFNLLISETAFSDLTLLVEQQQGYTASNNRKKTV